MAPPIELECPPAAKRGRSLGAVRSLVPAASQRIGRCGREEAWVCAARFPVPFPGQKWQICSGKLSQSFLGYRPKCMPTLLPFDRVPTRLPRARESLLCLSLNGGIHSPSGRRQPQGTAAYDNLRRRRAANNHASRRCCFAHCSCPLPPLGLLGRTMTQAIQACAWRLAMLVYPPRSAEHIGGRNSLQSPPSQWRWTRRALARLQKQAQCPATAKAISLAMGWRGLSTSRHARAVSFRRRDTSDGGVHTSAFESKARPGAAGSARERAGWMGRGHGEWRLSRLDDLVHPDPSPVSPPIHESSAVYPCHSPSAGDSTHHCAALRYDGHARPRRRPSVHSATADWSRLRVRSGLGWGDDPPGLAVAEGNMEVVSSEAPCTCIALLECLYFREGGTPAENEGGTHTRSLTRSPTPLPHSCMPRG